MSSSSWHEENDHISQGITEYAAKYKEFEEKEQKIRYFLGRPLTSTLEYSFRKFRFEFLKGNPVAPLPRSGHRIVCNEANVYSFGGYMEVRPSEANPHQELPVQQLFKELWEYNGLTSEWRVVKTYGQPPVELASHSMLLHGSYIVVFGGTGVPFGGCSSNKMHVCDLRTMTWHAVETIGAHPLQLYGQSVVMDQDGHAFYTVGGTTGYAYSMDIHKLDTRTFVWEPIYIAKGDSSEPRARYRHEITLYDGKIFVFGGGTSTEAFSLKEVPYFDLATRQWTLLTTTAERDEFPAPRKCHGMVRQGDEVIISGGCSGETIFNDIWKFDFEGFKWTRLPVNMPIRTYFHATAISPAGCLYIFGGVIDVKTSLRTEKMFKVWLKLPSLKEICWNAVYEYAREINPSGVDELLNSTFTGPKLPSNAPHRDVPVDYRAPDIEPRYIPVVEGYNNIASD